MFDALEELQDGEQDLSVVFGCVAVVEDALEVLLCVCARVCVCVCVRVCVRGD